jgi:hypothetical protein
MQVTGHDRGVETGCQEFEAQAIAGAAAGIANRKSQPQKIDDQPPLGALSSEPALHVCLVVECRNHMRGAA